MDIFFLLNIITSFQLKCKENYTQKYLIALQNFLRLSVRLVVLLQTLLWRLLRSYFKSSEYLNKKWHFPKYESYLCASD